MGISSRHTRALMRRQLLLAVALALQTRGPEVRGFLLHGAENSYSMPNEVILQGGDEFEYIVVGAGAGGSAAAARLALAGARVLLLEAGGDPGLFTRIPGATLALLGSDIDWQYKTVPNNKSCLSSEGGYCRFSRGKCLGGSTSINYMLYTRGIRQDYDNIGIPGWSYDELLPYFLRYEGLQDLDLLPDSSIPYHNTTGIMKIGFFADSDNPWHERLLNAYKILQIPFNPDVNAESAIGVSKLVGYVYGGQRMSTARAYLSRPDVKSRLKVAKWTTCTGVLVDQGNTARGVTVATRSGRSLKLYASKEVILSAGTIATPQILMLSGIGPADHLKYFGLPLKVDLPVGRDMSDHVLPLMFILVDKRTDESDTLKTVVHKVGDLAQLLVSNRGPFTSNGLTDLGVFLNSECYDFEEQHLVDKGSHCKLPDLQITHAYIDRGLLTLAKDLFRASTGLNENVTEQVIRANKQYALLILTPVLVQPQSRGHVRLASADPLARPAIYPNYLSEERDVDALERFARFVQQLVATRVLRQRGARLLRLQLAGCARAQYWRCYARHMTGAVFHAAGTSALGRVLDARLRVRGVRRLRVADLSALPYVPRGNTEAVAVAIGERVADFIRQDDGF